MPPLILASSSRYRAELLKKLQLDFITCSRGVDETPHPQEPADALAQRLSISKAQAVAPAYPDHLIIGSDQVAVCNDVLLGKPGNRANAFRQLKAQSSQKVTFYTGLCVLNSRTGQTWTDLDVCHVYFRELSESQIEHYLDVDQPFDCAGSFKSEGYGISLFSKIEGEDPNALIGLPLIKLIGLLNQCGLAIP